MTEFIKVFDKLKVSLFKKGLPNDPIKIQKDIPFDRIVSFGAIDGDRISRVDTRPFLGDSYLLLYEVPKGEFIRHFHESVESGIVLKGRAILKTPFKTATLNEGDVWRIEKHEWHTFEFTEPSLFVVLFSPFKSNEWEASLENEH